MSVGEKIRQARKRQGLTLKQLGERIGGIAHSSLSQIENGITNPTKRTLILLGNALNDDFGLEWLAEHLTGNDAPPSKKEVVEEMTTREFISLKFGGKQTRRSKAEVEMLAKLLDAELERIKEEGW